MIGRGAFICAFICANLCAQSFAIYPYLRIARKSARPRVERQLDTKILDAFRNALVGIFKEKGYKPNEKFNRAIDEVERALATAHSDGKKYRFDRRQVENFKNIMELTARTGKIENFRQALGRAIYAHLTAKAKEVSKNEALLDGAKAFLNDIKSNIGEEHFEQLVSVNGEVTLVFVIDTTGSMSEDIKAAKAIAEGIIEHERDVPVSFILSMFNDPDVRPIKFRDEHELNKAVDDLKNITVGGGGDCPEMTFEGMLNALYYSPMPGSAMYVFTDASPKDATEENIENVKALAIDLGIPIYFFTKGDCNDPGSTDIFRSVAQDTGGLMFPLHTSRQIEKLSNFVKQNLRGSATLSANNVKDAKKENRYYIAVDDTIEILIVTVTFSNHSSDDIGLRSPDNVAHSITHDLELNVIFEVARPKPGNWTLIVPRDAGDHEYSVKTISKVSIDFSHYYFKYPRRRRDGTHIPVNHPLLGEDAMVMIKVSEIDKIHPDSLSLKVIYKNGTDGGEYEVRKVGNSGVRFRATIKVDEGAYKLQLSGRTKMGHPFTRLTPKYDEAKPFRLRVVYARKYTLPLGKNSTLFLAIENPSPERNFMYSVADNFGYADNDDTQLRHKGPYHSNILFRLKFRVPEGDTANVNKTNKVVIKVTGEKSGIVSTQVMYLFIKEQNG